MIVSSRESSNRYILFRKVYNEQLWLATNYLPVNSAVFKGEYRDSYSKSL